MHAVRGGDGELPCGGDGERWRGGRKLAGGGSDAVVGVAAAPTEPVRVHGPRSRCDEAALPAQRKAREPSLSCTWLGLGLGPGLGLGLGLGLEAAGAVAKLHLVRVRVRARARVRIRVRVRRRGSRR